MRQNLFEMNRAFGAAIAGLLTMAACGGSGLARANGQLVADTSRPNNSTYVLGERVVVSFQATGLPPSQSTSLAIKVRDEFGTEAAATSLALAADGSGNATASLMAPATKYGYYRVEAVLPDGGTIGATGSRPAGFVSYAVVSDPSKRVNYGDSGSRFGMQGGFNLAQGSVIPYLGIRYFLAGPGFSDLEQKNAYQFSMARSAAVAKGQPYPAKSPTTNNLTYNGAPWPTYAVPLVMTEKLPPWALEPGTSGTICKTMGALNKAGAAAFPDFAYQLAQAYAADYPSQSSRYYQITWEPANWCFAGSIQQLVQFYQLAYEPLHRGDSKAMVMGPTLFPENGAMLAQMWAAGFGKYVDAVSMHPYSKWPPETNGLIANVREQMKMAQDAKGHPIPFLGTEHGYTSGTIGELNEALGNVRSTIMLLGEGFKVDFAFYIADYWDKEASDPKNTYGYYWNLNPNIPYGTDKIGPKPSAPAFSATTLFLDGTTTAGPLTNMSGTQMGYRFQRNGTTILALWDYQAPSSSFTLPANGNFQTCDWMGNCTPSSGGATTLTLGPAPTYVIGHDL